ncbi:hypothetical protein PIB30_075698, partial [Stylosanthes scabra]|nr:hypothetical protein [Stylosanthes scabra]
RGYHSDNSNDDYYSCEDSLSPHPNNCSDSCSQSATNEAIATLIQERIELREAQKRSEIQSGAIIEISNYVFNHFVSQHSASLREDLSANTSCSGTQLKGPTVGCSSNKQTIFGNPTTPETQGNKKRLLLWKSSFQGSNTASLLNCSEENKEEEGDRPLHD